MILPEEISGGPFPGARFAMGRFFVTPAALDALSAREMAVALGRHLSGDWGDLCPGDVEENELSVREGYRILSAYHSETGAKFWIITEADRSATTILLPSDY
jgi:hypothetical protein